MKSLNTKIASAALGFAVLATPAFAQRQHRQPQDYSAVQSAPVEHYLNGGVRTGTAANRESGAEFNLDC
jgi:hypothetical protein